MATEGGIAATRRQPASMWCTCMLTSTQTHQELGLPFRGYVPLLMDLLEDADGMVRDTAKTTVIELFKLVLHPRWLNHV